MSNLRANDCRFLKFCLAYLILKLNNISFNFMTFFHKFLLFLIMAAKIQLCHLQILIYNIDEKVYESRLVIQDKV